MAAVWTTFRLGQVCQASRLCSRLSRCDLRHCRGLGQSSQCLSRRTVDAWHCFPSVGAALQSLVEFGLYHWNQTPPKRPLCGRARHCLSCFDCCALAIDFSLQISGLAIYFAAMLAPIVTLSLRPPGKKRTLKEQSTRHFDHCLTMRSWLNIFEFEHIYVYLFELTNIELINWAFTTMCLNSTT